MECLTSITSLFDLLRYRRLSSDDGFHFCIPETVVYSNGAIRMWLYTDHSGQVVVRDKKDSKREFIPEQFCPHQYEVYQRLQQVPKRTAKESEIMMGNDTVVAVMYSTLDRWAEGERPLQVSFLTFRTLFEFCALQDDSFEGILQKFVVPLGSNNTTIQVLWSPYVTTATRVENAHPMNDRKSTVRERHLTVEGNEKHVRSSSITASSIPELNKAATTLAKYIQIHHAKIVTRMVLYLRFDRRKKLNLLFCSQVLLTRNARAPAAFTSAAGVLRVSGGLNGSVDASVHSTPEGSAIRPQSSLSDLRGQPSSPLAAIPNHNSFNGSPCASSGGGGGGGCGSVSPVSKNLSAANIANARCSTPPSPNNTAGPSSRPSDEFTRALTLSQAMRQSRMCSTASAPTLRLVQRRVMLRAQGMHFRDVEDIGYRKQLGSTIKSLSHNVASLERRHREEPLSWGTVSRSRGAASSASPAQTTAAATTKPLEARARIDARLHAIPNTDEELFCHQLKATPWYAEWKELSSNARRLTSWLKETSYLIESLAMLEEDASKVTIPELVVTLSGGAFFRLLSAKLENVGAVCDARSIVIYQQERRINTDATTTTVVGGRHVFRRVAMLLRELMVEVEWLHLRQLQALLEQISCELRESKMNTAPDDNDAIILVECVQRRLANLQLKMNEFIHKHPELGKRPSNSITSQTMVSQHHHRDAHCGSTLTPRLMSLHNM
eukprot:PhM_4_TR8097/c0_g1_i1/m.51658